MPLASVLKKPTVKRVAATLASGVLFTLLLSAIWGSPARAFRLLAGTPLTLKPSVVELGSGSAGTSRDLEILLFNDERSTLELVGARASCGCLNTDKFPMKVLGGSRCRLTVKAVFTGNGHFEHNIVYYTNCATQPYLTLTVVGSTESTPSSPSGALSRTVDSGSSGM